MWHTAKLYATPQS